MFLHKAAPPAQLPFLQELLLGEISVPFQSLTEKLLTNLGTLKGSPDFEKASV